LRKGGINMRASSRVTALGESVRGNMLIQKHNYSSADSVFSISGADREPLIIRNALAVKMKLYTVPIAIWPGQLIPGSVTLPENGLAIGGSLPEYATKQEIEEAGQKGFGVNSIVGHIVPSYPKLLKKGAGGIKREAERYLKNAKTENSKAFYRACAIVMEALELFALRHAALCDELSTAEPDEKRRGELRGMAADLRIAPCGPAESFAQAVTSIWLTHIAFQLTGNHLAIGRFDQHVFPYLQADLAKGAITEENAREIVDCFFLKFNERAQDNGIPYNNTDFEKAREKNEAQWANRSPFDHSTQRANARDNVDATNHWLQNVIIGGVKTDGSDASNPVTFMCLEAFDKNRMTNPCLTVRLSSESPDDLYKKSCETLVNGGGLPAFFNDDAIIPALVKWGVAIEDARDYTNDGCWEIIIAGKNDFYFDRFNMLRCLEWALNRGRSRVDGKLEAPDPGDASGFSSYGETYEAFLSELYYELDGLMEKNHREFGQRCDIAPVPLLSALLEGPMESGNDMTRAGAKYVTYGLIGEGVSHVIDSLAAVKKVIFEDGAATMAELLKALDDNFTGHEALRAKLLAAPKYGRNDRYADDIGKDIFEKFAEKVAELNNKYTNMIFLPGAGTFSWYIAIGEGCGPSPDGRLANEAVSSNLSPSSGAATRGVTGSILSHAAFDMHNLPVGSPTDLRLSSKIAEGADGLNRLVSIIKSFISLGGNMLTLTIADTALLRRAQANPEQYRDLRVRMGGWSAYFTMLSKEQQEHHIGKEEGL
jgi:formate C-acetyltransferase